MKITVQHEVSPDKNFCTYDGYFYGKDVCQYYERRYREYERKAPYELKIPRCTLFRKWLNKPRQKCEECIKACEQAERMEE